jgi:hypothetical protein
MPETSYFDKVTTRSAYAELLGAANDKTLAALQDTHRPASQWSREHLLACRVVRSSREHTVLPVLESSLTTVALDPRPPEIASFLNGPPAGFRYRSEHQLHRDHGTSLGQVWSALGSVMRVQVVEIGNAMLDIDHPMTDSSDDSPPRKRARTQPQHENFVDITTVTLGDSSPVQESNSQESIGQGSVGFIDGLVNGPPEDDTFYLASSVIRHILCFAPPQDGCDLRRVVEFRVAKRRIAVDTDRLLLPIRATDDGGLCLREMQADGTFALIDEHVAIIEAKRQFQQIEEGRPIVADRLFAQMTCEAIAAKLHTRRTRGAVGNTEYVA